MDETEVTTTPENEKEKEKEELPTWAQQLKQEFQELKESLTPKQEQQDETTEIVLPQIPEQEHPTPEQITEENPLEQEQETPKKKKGFLDWLL